MRRNNLIEASRGAAALAVVGYHAGAFIAPKYWGVDVAGAWLGRYGVHFFFLLSGFLMMRLHGNQIGNPAHLRSFVRRRAERIYPAYWLAMGVAAGALFAFPHLGSSEQRSASNLVRGVLLLGEPSNVLSVAWTLHHEVLFYAMFALLIAHRAVGMIAMAGWFTLCAIGFDTYAAQPINLLFGVGMMAGAMLPNLPEVRMPVMALRLGQASYAIYLVHYPVLGVCGMMLAGVPVAVGLPAAIAAAISAGVVFHHVVEGRHPILFTLRRWVEAEAAVFRFVLSSKKT